MRDLCHHYRNVSTQLKKLIVRELISAGKTDAAKQAMLQLARLEKSLRDYQERLGYDPKNATK